MLFVKMYVLKCWGGGLESGKTVRLSAYLDVARRKKISKLKMVPLMVVEVSRGTWAQG